MSSTPDLSLTAEQQALRPLRELYFEVGLVLSSPEQARFVEAIAAYEQALKEQDSPLPAGEIYAYLARSYECLENIQQAFRTYLKAIADAPQWISNLLPSVHILLKQLTPEALHEEDEWLQQTWLPEIAKMAFSEADQASIALFLGRINLYLQHYEKALDYYRQAQQIQPQSLHVLEGLGQALMHLGELDQSAAVFRQAYTLAQEQNQTERIIAICNKLARTLAASGQYRAAIKQFYDTYALIGEKIDSIPDYACKMYLTMAQCYLALGETNIASEAIKEASKYELLKTSSIARTTYDLLRTQIFISLRQFREALNAADEALQLNPFNNEALLYKIQTLFEGVIDVQQARRQLRRYTKKVGDEKTALQHAQTAAAQHSDGNGHYFLAQVYYMQGRYAEARKELEQAQQLKLTNASSTANVALTQLTAELFEAEGQAQEAADNFYAAGRELYITTTQYAEAIELFTHAVELKPNHELALLFLSSALSAQAATTTPPSGELLQQALETWDKSYALGLPPVNPEWAYAGRAATLIRMAALNPDKADDLRWETACYLERAVLLDTSQEYLWSMLLGNYSDLRKMAVAHQINQQHPTPFNQAWMYYLDDDEQTIDAIDRYSEASGQTEIDPDANMDFQKAIWFYLRGQYELAIQNIHHFQQLFPDRDTAGLHYFLGRLYRLNGQAREALKTFQWIWDATSPGGKFATDENLEARADAAFELGDYDEARSIYQIPLAGAAKKSGSSHASLAYCYLLLGQIDAARQELEESLNYTERIVNGRLILLDMREVENKLQQLADSAQQQQLLQEYRAKIEEKISGWQTNTADEQDAVEELRSILQDTQVQQGSFAWLAAQAALARLSIEAGSWQSARARYETLLKYNNENSSHSFPEAIIGLARAYALSGCDAALGGDRKTALHDLKHSLDLYAQAGQSNPALAMVHDCDRLIHSQEQYSIMSRCLRLLADVYTLDYSERQNLLVARFTLSREKYPTLIHPIEFNEPADGEKLSKWENEFGWTTPGMGTFAIELGVNLLIIGDHATVEDSVEADLMNTCLPRIRTRIREQFGVIVPGLQIRDNLQIAGQAYQFLSYDKLLATGTVLPNERYCPDANSCRALGIEGTSMANPIDGNEGYWLATRAAWEQAQNAHLPLWSPYEYITFHLETVLQANLKEMIGVEEAQITVREWADESKADRQELVREALPDDLAVAQLARVLRGLVEEQVPIKHLEIILPVFAQERAKASSEIIAAVRHALHAPLPGNQAEQQTADFSLDSEFSSTTLRQEAMHLQSDVAPLPETGPLQVSAILPFVLQSLADSGITNANQSLVLQIIDTESKYHTSAEDIVEIAFARLRSNRIIIHLAPEYADTSFPSVSDSILSEFFHKVEEKIFHERGILLPQFESLFSTNARESNVQINDQSILLCPMPYPFDDELANNLFAILSKSAKALVSIDDVEYRLARLYPTHPTLIRAALATFSLEDITRAARDRVNKQKSILDLRLLLEHLLASTPGVATSTASPIPDLTT